MQLDEKLRRAQQHVLDKNEFERVVDVDSIDVACIVAVVARTLGATSHGPFANLGIICSHWRPFVFTKAPDASVIAAFRAPQLMATFVVSRLVEFIKALCVVKKTKLPAVVGASNVTTMAENRIARVLDLMGGKMPEWVEQLRLFGPNRGVAPLVRDFADEEGRKAMGGVGGVTLSLEKLVYGEWEHFTTLPRVIVAVEEKVRSLF